MNRSYVRSTRNPAQAHVLHQLRGWMGGGAGTVTGNEGSSTSNFSPITPTHTHTRRHARALESNPRNRPTHGRGRAAAAAAGCITQTHTACRCPWCGGVRPGGQHTNQTLKTLENRLHFTGTPRCRRRSSDVRKAPQQQNPNADYLPTSGVADKSGQRCYSYTHAHTRERRAHHTTEMARAAESVQRTAQTERARRNEYRRRCNPRTNTHTHVHT